MADQAAIEVDYAPVPDFVLRRKPPPEAPPPFFCVGRGHTVQPSPWPYDEHQTPPLCESCTRHWMSVTRLGIPGTTRGDFRRLQRLSALVNLIQWEAINGSR